MSVKYTILTEYFNSLLYFVLAELLLVGRRDSCGCGGRLIRRLWATYVSNNNCRHTLVFSVSLLIKFDFIKAHTFASRICPATGISATNSNIVVFTGF